MDKEFPKRLQICLTLRNKKPIHLADNCGLSRGLVSQYLNGQRTPKAQQIMKIAEYLDVSPTYLLGLSDQIVDYDIKLHQHLELSEEDLQRQALMNEIDSLCSYASLDTLRMLRVLVKTVCKNEDLK